MISARAFFEPTDSAVVEYVSKRNLRDGEQKLMLAVLENATEDFQKYIFATDKRGQELFQEVEEWILETNSPSFFSFESICAHLDLNADYVRRGFMRWKAAQQKGEVTCTRSNGKRRSA